MLGNKIEIQINMTSFFSFFYFFYSSWLCTCICKYMLVSIMDPTYGFTVYTFDKLLENNWVYNKIGFKGKIYTIYIIVINVHHRKTQLL